jgi:hypothetical protein
MAVRLQLKFHDGAPEHERADVLAAIAASGEVTARPLFPDERDPELASLYTVDGVPDADADALAQRVGAHAAVEFIGPPERRRLVR